MDEPRASTQQLSAPLDPATIQILKSLIAQFSPLTPAGAITGFGSDTPPDGWLLCDGSAVSRTTYAALFAVIGTNFGIGDGSTTFNLPDGRTQVMAGKKAADPNFGAFGNVAAGETAHQLVTSEIPSHTHSVAIPGANAGSFARNNFQENDNFIGNITVTSGSTGGDGTHNNIQPTFVANYIIKT
jgi:microcystin-dependent protein